MKIKSSLFLLLILTACSAVRNNPQNQLPLTATVPTGDGQAIEPTEAGLESEAIVVEGTVADASASAALIWLMDPIDGFEAIAVAEDTVLADGNGNELRMNEVQPGMVVRAEGTGGQSDALIASRVVLFPASGLPNPDHSVLLTYLDPDGNVWLYDEQVPAAVQVTTEASRTSSGSTIEFQSPILSSDGTLIAVERQERSISAEMMTIKTSLWIYDVTDQSATEIYDQDPVGFDWKPGSHLLAYVPALDEAYFSSRGQVDSDYATSIVGYDYDTGAASEIVSPEGGFALARPTWSPSGRFISFEEVQGYEGSGWFAYFDFESNSYASWNRAIGNYDWLPDEGSIIYDELTYTGSGTEWIWLSDRAGANSSQLSQEFGWGVVAQPSFSPEGDQVTYLYYRAKSEGQPANVHVQQVDGGELIDLGAFDNVGKLDWTQDDQNLVIEAGGPSGQTEILLLSLDSNEIERIAIGTQPSLAQHQPAGEGLSDWEAAEKALRSFFQNLNRSEYEAAVDLYGGSYSTMRNHNPSIDEENLAALLRAACEINGAQCLATAGIRPVQRDDLPEGEFLFAVQFRKEDGEVFSLGPCCGGDSGGEVAETEFYFKVRKDSEYLFKVLDPPIYSP